MISLFGPLEMKVVTGANQARVLVTLGVTGVEQEIYNYSTGTDTTFNYMSNC
jgi:hypothetical protein